jgi:CheY-like chemotaxis protein
MVNQKIALVVDDEKEIVTVVSDVLKNDLHYLVLAATDSEVARDLAQSYLFDLLILDLHMPKLDGFQLLDLVRKKQPDIKVLVITGLLDVYEQQLARADVDFIVEKPFDFPKFKRDIVSLAGAVEPVSVLGQSKEIPKAKILLVDDEKEQCEYLREFILDDNPNEYEVEIADTAEEGIIRNNDFSPDIILFDIKMPHMRGDEMMERIQSSEPHKPRLFGIISAVAQPDTIKKMQSKGCPYLTKPFRIEEVLRLLRSRCQSLGLVRQFGASEEPGGSR